MVKVPVCRLVSLEVPIAIRPVPRIAANEAIEHVCEGLNRAVSIFDVACPFREAEKGFVTLDDG